MARAGIAAYEKTVLLKRSLGFNARSSLALVHNAICRDPQNTNLGRAAAADDGLIAVLNSLFSLRTKPMDVDKGFGHARALQKVSAPLRPHQI